MLAEPAGETCDVETSEGGLGQQAGNASCPDDGAARPAGSKLAEMRTLAFTGERPPPVNAQEQGRPAHGLTHRFTITTSDVLTGHHHRRIPAHVELVDERDDVAFERRCPSGGSAPNALCTGPYHVRKMSIQ